MASLGKNRLVDDIASDDFEALRAALAKRCNPNTLGNEVQRIRTLFKYAYDAGLIDKPMRFGPTFKRPAKRILRAERQRKGERMFEARQIRREPVFIPQEFAPKTVVRISEFGWRKWKRQDRNGAKHERDRKKKALPEIRKFIYLAVEERVQKQGKQHHEIARAECPTSVRRAVAAQRHHRDDNNRNLHPMATSPVFTRSNESNYRKDQNRRVKEQTAGRRKEKKVKT